MVKGRDSRGRFIKGNIPWNKRLDSTQREISFTCKFCGEQKPFEEMEVATKFSPPLPVCRDCSKLLESGDLFLSCVCAKCKKPWGASGSPARCLLCGQASFAIVIETASQATSASKAKWQDPEYRAALGEG